MEPETTCHHGRFDAPPKLRLQIFPFRCCECGRPLAHMFHRCECNRPLCSICVHLEPPCQPGAKESAV